jgi:hypothetical protein
MDRFQDCIVDKVKKSLVNLPPGTINTAELSCPPGLTRHQSRPPGFSH